MKKTYISLALLITLLLFHGCKKDADLACLTHNMPVTITAISGPDSMRRDTQESLIFEVEAPGICVADVEITMSPYSDTVYHAAAMARYSPATGGCNCEIKDKHYARVYFSSPTPGSVTINSMPGIGQPVTHTIKVY